MASKSKSKNRLYAQTSKDNIKEIIKNKDAFSKLSFKNIIEIHNVTNNIRLKNKPKLNITTKSLSKKQIIILMSTNNSEEVILKVNEHILNINRLLKGVKSNISADYICSDSKKVFITTNKIAASFDLNIVEKYMKDLNNINTNDIMSPQLPQLKFYLKILEVSYFLENTNLLITSNIIEMVIKDSYIFNNIILAFWPHIIKVSFKSDIAVI